MRIEGFVIHLARAQQRRPQVEQLRQVLPMPVHVVDAVDGRTLAQEEIDAVYGKKLHRPHYPFDLRAGEVGCFLSHRKAWHEIVRRDLDAALIFEDDVELDPEIFDKALHLAEPELDRYPYIQFLTKPIRGKSTPIGGSGECIISRCEVVPLKTPGQLVSREAAERLILRTGTFDRPVDTFLQMPWITGAAIASIYPSGLSESMGGVGGSTIGQSKPFADRLVREVKRWRFRRDLRTASKKFGGYGA